MPKWNRSPETAFVAVPCSNQKWLSSLCYDAISWLRTLHWVTAISIPSGYRHLCCIRITAITLLCLHPTGPPSISVPWGLSISPQPLAQPMDRACLAMGLFSPGAECPGNVPAFQYKIQPGEGMGEIHVGLSHAMLKKFFPFTCWERSFLLFIGE